MVQEAMAAEVAAVGASATSAERGAAAAAVCACAFRQVEAVWVASVSMDAVYKANHLRNAGVASQLLTPRITTFLSPAGPEGRMKEAALSGAISGGNAFIADEEQRKQQRLFDAQLRPQRAAYMEHVLRMSEQERQAQAAVAATAPQQVQHLQAGDLDAAPRTLAQQDASRRQAETQLSRAAYWRQ